MATSKKPKLPFPRLELRWRPATKAETASSDFGAKWVCDYILVLHKRHAGDGRCNGPTGAYSRRDVEFVLGNTYVSGEVPFDGINVGTPFRDGAHIQWDAAVLNIPAFAVYGSKVSKVIIRD